VESLGNIVTGTLLEPIEIGSAVTVTTALVSGAAARVVEAWQDRPSRAAPTPPNDR
jgi:hypothetical protein